MPGAAVGPAVAAVQDLQQGPAEQLGVLVGLHEPARAHARAELGLAGVPDRLDRGVVDRAVLDVGVGAAGGQQPQEVRLARAVAAQHRDPLAVPDLEVERLHQPGQLEALADHGALAGAAALEPHRHLLLARLLGRRPGLLELAEPGLRGLVLRGHAVVVLRLDLQPEHQRLDLGVLLVPAPAHLLERANRSRRASWYDANPPGCVHTQVAAAERAELDGDDPRRGVVRAARGRG